MSRAAGATLKQIADRSGYSHATVSSVLNGRTLERRIGAAAARKVEAAARALGHAPGGASALAVITSFETPLLLVSRAARALRTACEARQAGGGGYRVLIELFPAGRLRDLPEFLTRERFAGALIANTLPADDRFLASVRLPFPVVLIGREVAGYPCVLENARTGSAAARRLIEAGCRRCAVLAPALPTATHRARQADFMTAIREARLATPVLLRCSDRSEMAGYGAMKGHLRRSRRGRKRRPLAAQGIFALGDALAVGAYRAVKEAALRIPDDIRFVGIGDDEAAPFLDPPLTCVGSSQDALHAEAAKLLVRLLAGSKPPQRPLRLPLAVFEGGSAPDATGTSPLLPR